jgi:hypothetical protein
MSPPSKPAPKAVVMKYENTPPPSPEAETAELDDSEVKREVATEVKREIDLEGINDEIVEGVIVQLQKTGNRPHLVKELALVLSSSVKIVETFVPLNYNTPPELVANISQQVCESVGDHLFKTVDLPEAIMLVCVGALPDS